MVRKLLLTGLIATGLMGGLTTASAQTPFPQIGGVRPIAVGEPYPGRGHQHQHHHVHYQVLVRHGYHWDLYDTFHDSDDARRAAWRLERRGHDAKIVVVHKH